MVKSEKSFILWLLTSKWLIKQSLIIFMLVLDTLGYPGLRSRMVASTCGIQSPSNRKVPLKAMDHENITKPMKGIDWRALSPPVNVMDTSAVSSISISPTKEMSEVFSQRLRCIQLQRVWNVPGVVYHVSGGSPPAPHVPQDSQWRPSGRCSA